MGGEKKISVDRPQFQSDPRFQQGINQLQSLGGRLSSFDFSGDLAPLAQTIDLDPEITRLALEQAQLDLGPAFEDTINQIKQEAAGANQLESSTFTNALSREAGRLNQQFQSITTGAALNDRLRALTSRLGIVGLGGDFLTQGTSFAGQNQQQQNQLKQQDFENQLGLATVNQDNRGGLLGGITGFLGGAGGGFAAGGLPGGIIGGVLGGVGGALGPQGTGGQFLQGGSSILAADPFSRIGRGQEDQTISDIANPFKRNPLFGALAGF